MWTFLFLFFLNISFFLSLIRTLRTMFQSLVFLQVFNSDGYFILFVFFIFFFELVVTEENKSPSVLISHLVLCYVFIMFFLLFFFPELYSLTICFASSLMKLLGQANRTKHRWLLKIILHRHRLVKIKIFFQSKGSENPLRINVCAWSSRNSFRLNSRELEIHTLVNLDMLMTFHFTGGKSLI